MPPKQPKSPTRTVNNPQAAPNTREPSDTSRTSHRRSTSYPLILGARPDDWVGRRMTPAAPVQSGSSRGGICPTTILLGLRVGLNRRPNGSVVNEKAAPKYETPYRQGFRDNNRGPGKMRNGPLARNGSGTGGSSVYKLCAPGPPADGKEYGGEKRTGQPGGSTGSRSANLPPPNSCLGSFRVRKGMARKRMRKWRLTKPAAARHRNWSVSGSHSHTGIKRSPERSSFSRASVRREGSGNPSTTPAQMAGGPCRRESQWGDAFGGCQVASRQKANLGGLGGLEVERRVCGPRSCQCSRAKLDAGCPRPCGNHVWSGRGPGPSTPREQRLVEGDPASSRSAMWRFLDLQYQALSGGAWADALDSFGPIRPALARR